MYGGYFGGQGHEGVDPEVLAWFYAVDQDDSGQINWDELQHALLNGQGKKFSDTACKLMIGMFDKDGSGTIDINEFKLLFPYITQWVEVFNRYDKDRSGYIEESELAQGLHQMGYRFSPEFIKFLMAQCDHKHLNRLSMDQFIVLCVQIQRLTDAFRARDNEMKGIITIGYEDLLSVVINCFL